MTADDDGACPYCGSGLVAAAAGLRLTTDGSKIGRRRCGSCAREWDIVSDPGSDRWRVRLHAEDGPQSGPDTAD